MKKTKTQNGVTLIVLVITIIVLVILAAVAIVSIVGDNGVTSQAKNAKVQTIVSNIEEIVEVIRTDYYSKNNSEYPTSRYIIEQLIERNEINSNQVQDYGDESGIGIVTVENETIQISGKKMVSASELRNGDHVMYRTEDGVPIECVVLWDSTTSWGASGVQIITTDVVGDYSIGSEDATEAKEIYDNAVDMLNDRAALFLNEEIAVRARCVGGVPDGNDTESMETYNGIDYMKGTDENYKIDVNQMLDLGIYYTGTDRNHVTNNKYWLASRYLCHQSYWNYLDILQGGDYYRMPTWEIGINAGHKAISTIYIYTSTFNLHSGQVLTSGYRPVFVLKQDANIELIRTYDGSGPDTDIDVVV